MENKKTAVALGIFDGIHDGHRLILKKALSYTAFTPAVFTFITETIKIKHGKQFEYIYPNWQKVEYIEKYGFSYIEAFDFEKLRNLSGEEFVKQILISKMNAGAVVCGENFHFGKNAACGAEDLKGFGKKYGFDVGVITLEMKADNPVSSESIREYLHHGRVRRLHDELNFDYCIKSKVSEGNKIGRTIDFPTINQKFAEGQLVPKRGVYKSRVSVNGIAYDGVTNIGVRPTIGDIARPISETHILDFSGELYEKNISAVLTDFIRDERKFSSVTELKKQINEDIKSVRKGMI